MEQHTDLTKLARWVIPGWIAAFSFFLFISVDTLTCTNESLCIFASMDSLISRITSVDPVLATFLIAITGVPTGLLIYQFYFYMRWSSPAARRGFTSLAPGIMTDIRQALRNMDTPDAKHVLSRNERWRWHILEHPLYETEHGFKSRYIDFLFIELASETKADLIYQRRRYLHEITHILGGTLTAVAFGFSGYTLLKFHYRSSPFSTSYLLISLALIGILAAFLENESHWIERLRQRICFTPQCRIALSRKAASAPLAAICVNKRIAYPHLSAFPVITMLFVHFIANPYFEPRSLFSPSSPLRTRFTTACFNGSPLLSPHSCLLWLLLVLFILVIVIAVYYYMAARTSFKFKTMWQHLIIATTLLVSAYFLAHGVRIALSRNPDYALSLIDTVVRLFLMGAISVWWILTINKKYPLPFFWGALIQSAASILIALFIAWAALHSTTEISLIDWPYLTSLTLFLIIFLILLRNRRNAKNELLSLEYLFLSKHLKPSCATDNFCPRPLNAHTAALLAEFLGSTKL